MDSNRSDSKFTDEKSVQSFGSLDRSSSVSSINSGTSGASADNIVFTSPFEDTSGLDVFAQIAASACPLPTSKNEQQHSLKSITDEKPKLKEQEVKEQINPLGPVQQAPQIVRRASESTSIVHQSQSQLAQSIYQSQQALRMQQQKPDSVVSNFNSFKSNIEGEAEDFDEDFDEDYDSDSEDTDVIMIRSPVSSGTKNESIDGKMNNTLKNTMNTFKSSSSSNLLLETPIQEETESDLMMDIDPAINFQRRRSPSLSVSNETSPQAIYARRLSAPDGSLNFTGASGYSTRRVIHNICERKRRENIREGFDHLQNRLPVHMANNPKLSKMEILSGATSLIKDIRARVSNLAAEVSALTLVADQMKKKNESTNSGNEVN